MKKNNIKRDWYIIDAKGKVLGRLASKVAQVLYGKGKVNYMPNQDMGDFVIIINAKQVAVTGKKMDNKFYRRHTGYPGGLKEESLRKLLDRKPEEPIIKAIKGMLPKNKLAKEALKRLKVYASGEYPKIKEELKELK